MTGRSPESRILRSFTNSVFLVLCYLIYFKLTNLKLF